MLHLKCRVPNNSIWAQNFLDQDDFWLNQPKTINLIDSKVLEQLYGFIRTHVALEYPDELLSQRWSA